MITPAFRGTVSKGRVMLNDIEKYRTLVSQLEGKQIKTDVKERTEDPQPSGQPLLLGRGDQDHSGSSGLRC